ncbi:ATP-binding protein [bacterium]|nr:ATP-binding protein [bacterium]
MNDLKKKLSFAVSGFGNSGGGYFLAGIDGSGNADGGFPERIGNQDLRDWADQIIHQVGPTPSYEIKLLYDPKGRGVIYPNHCVLAVGIHESESGPHMAPDNRYYIRAGAHTVASRHFITDAIWAKRHFAKPRLTHAFRPKPDYHQAIQLGIVALTPAPAVDVEISLFPLGELLRENSKYFPLRIPMIDRDNPFFFDVTTWHQAEERFGNSVRLSVTYKDLANNSYKFEKAVSIANEMAPLVIGSDPMEKMAKALESIEKLLKKHWC